MIRFFHASHRLVQTRPSIFACGLLTVLIVVLLPEQVFPVAVTRWLLGWNVGVLLYIAMAVWMMAKSTHDHIQIRAHSHDEGKFIILSLVVVASVVCLIAIAKELAAAAHMKDGYEKNLHVMLAAVTVLSSWVFTQIMFALHYAHDFYSLKNRHQDPGLGFPGTEQPRYSDFFYFSVIIGTSGQTADVSFTSSKSRRIGTVHCILSYLFNTTILALLVNLGASLLGS